MNCKKYGMDKELANRAKFTRSVLVSINKWNMP